MSKKKNLTKIRKNIKNQNPTPQPQSPSQLNDSELENITGGLGYGSWW